MPKTDDLRIREIKELVTPSHLIRELPCTPKSAKTVADARVAMHRILHGQDDRLIVVIGPCSIHDIKAATAYALRLQRERERFINTLEIVMRVYFEKPRTTVGWKGLINDPYLDNSYQINDGLHMASEILVKVNEMGLPAATEFLDMISPQYIADLVSWGAIGARTTESQIHRQLASALPCPVGFKNGTDGGVQVALDAIRSAAGAHSFPAITADGRAAIARTTGNDACHLVLRGGNAGPNYAASEVAAVAAAAARAGVRPGIVIDASHANSGKDPQRQPAVIANIAAQITGGEARIRGVMLESNLVAGRQDLVPGQPLLRGQSITDGCLGWDDTRDLLHRLADAVTTRLAVAA